MGNSFSNMAGCRIYLWKSIDFLLTNKHTEKETMDSLLFIIASKKVNNYE